MYQWVHSSCGVLLGVITGIHIYIYTYLFLHITATVNLYYNSNSLKMLADFEMPRLRNCSTKASLNVISSVKVLFNLKDTSYAMSVGVAAPRDFRGHCSYIISILTSGVYCLIHNILYIYYICSYIMCNRTLELFYNSYCVKKMAEFETPRIRNLAIIQAQQL